MLALFSVFYVSGGSEITDEELTAKNLFIVTCSFSMLCLRSCVTKEQHLEHGQQRRLEPYLFLCSGYM